MSIGRIEMNDIFWVILEKFYLRRKLNSCTVCYTHKSIFNESYIQPRFILRNTSGIPPVNLQLRINAKHKNRKYESFKWHSEKSCSLSTSINAKNDTATLIGRT